MYILKHYFKSENKTDDSDFTKFGMKIGPVPDLQELPCQMMYSLNWFNVFALNRTEKAKD